MRFLSLATPMEPALDSLLELVPALKAAPATASGQRKSEALYSRLVFQSDRLLLAAARPAGGRRG